jgi:hypothetical protein
VKRPALLAGKPDPGVLHPLPQRLARHRQPVIFLQFFRGQGRTEIRIALTDQRHGKLPHRRIDPAVRDTAARPVTDGGRAIGSKPLKMIDGWKAASTSRTRRSTGMSRRARRPACDPLARQIGGGAT